MPHLQRDNGPKRQPCPDSTTLSAFMENQLGGSDRDAIAAHMARCSECAELHDRLVRFSKASAAMQDPEWENTEKRLAIWMTGFLDAHAGARQLADRTPTGNSAKRWNGWHSGKLQLAMSGVAALALLVGAAILFKPALHKEEAQVAAHRNLPVENPTTPPAVETKPETAAEKPATTQQAVPSAPGASKQPDVTVEARPNIHDSATQGISQQAAHQQPEHAVNSSATPPAEPPPQREQSEIAHADISAPGPEVHGMLPMPSRVPASHGSTSRPANRATGVHAASGNPSVELATQPVAGTTPASGIQGQTTAASSPPVKLRAPSGTAMATPAMVYPSIYRIAADTRFWIKLNAVNHQPDGSFTFQGSLLEPVTETGGALLRRGTQVVGSGVVSQGKTSLLVTQIVVGAHRYSLKGASGANARGPGAGPAVEFEAGKVLEMFLDSASVYEKAADGSESQAPN